MTQSNFIIPDSDGLTFLTNLNTALQALATQNSGAGNPATMYAYEMKADTATGYLYQRNSANNDWIAVRTLDPSAPTSVYSGGNYAITYAPAITALKSTVLYKFVADVTCTDSITFSINGIGTNNVFNTYGYWLTAGDIYVGRIYYFYYRPTGGYVVINPSHIVAPPYTHYTDTKTSGTNAGTFTSGSWINRDFQARSGEVVHDGYVYCSPGVTRINISCPAYQVGFHQARLYNETDGTVALIGSTAYSNTSGGDVTQSIISGTVSVTATKTFRVQHRCQTTKADNGLGAAAGFGNNEIYVIIEMWQE